MHWGLMLAVSETAFLLRPSPISACLSGAAQRNTWDFSPLVTVWRQRILPLAKVPLEPRLSRCDSTSVGVWRAFHSAFCQASFSKQDRAGALYGGQHPSSPPYTHTHTRKMSHRQCLAFCFLSQTLSHTATKVKDQILQVLTSAQAPAPSVVSLLVLD